MFSHPELTMALAREHRREMIAGADRWRLLHAARQHRADLRRGGPSTGAGARGRPAACGPCVAAAH
ncbi:hypothetical protein [Rhizomonospora bruguierae]|uniref:hypothetical protein n=1 Tax=Rhizomonospora bruguierae TaxID=1581705 RepID=UPI001BCEB31D|nr:hypothetical protein [Micromonospora sp. NBRC 107566]